MISLAFSIVLALAIIIGKTVLFLSLLMVAIYVVSVLSIAAFVFVMTVLSLVLSGIGFLILKLMGAI